MDATIPDQNFALSVLGGPPGQNENFIVAVNAAADNERLVLEFVKSETIHKMPRTMEQSNSWNNQPDLALM